MTHSGPTGESRRVRAGCEAGNGKPAPRLVAYQPRIRCSSTSGDFRLPNRIAGGLSERIRRLLAAPQNDSFHRTEKP
jgi:hypothetical protein